MARQDFSATGMRSEPAWEAKFRLLDAELLLRQNRNVEALALLTGPPPFPMGGESGIKWHLLAGEALCFVGRKAEGNRELREAHRLAEVSQPPLMADVLWAEATVLFDEGLIDQAREKYTTSLAIARRHDNVLRQAVDLVDLSYLSLQSEHFEQAAALSQEAIDFARATGNGMQLQYGLGNLGWAYVELGEFELALLNFRQAEQEARDLGLEGPRVLWLQDAGLAEYHLGHLQQARAYDERALEAALKLPDDATDQIVNIETNLALLLYAQGDYQGAKDYSDKAALEARRSKDATVIAYPVFLQGLVASRLSSGSEAERLLIEAHQSTPDPEMRMEVENALANFYSRKREPRRAEPWYRRSISTFEHNRSSVQDEGLRLSSFAYGDSVYRDYAEFLIEARRPAEALELLDHSRARTLSEGLRMPDEPGEPHKRAVDPRTVASALGATILFYSLGPEQSHLWAVSAHGTRLFTLPSEGEIKAWVAEYQRAIQKSTDPLQTPNPAGIALYEALVKPAAAMIPSGSRVFLVPDGVLHSLNFETLLVPSAGGYKYWIEDVTLIASSSIRILLRWQHAPASVTARDLLLIGDPLSSGSDFEALPNAGLEIERVRRHFGPNNQTVIAQARAVPSAYAANQPEQFTYIHFVAHGTASRLRPLDSAVMLSPASADSPNFKLYAREIVTHPLNARLVTISACNGSGLRTYAGEGLVGLAWAFLRAGSHNVIAALWQADDSATPSLMDALYSDLEAGRAPEAALRNAKLSLIRSSGTYRKPLYWGAFQLYAGS